MNVVVSSACRWIECFFHFEHQFDGQAQVDAEIYKLSALPGGSFLSFHQRLRECEPFHHEFDLINNQIKDSQSV